jgi:chitin disaccharide deacetylase
MPPNERPLKNEAQAKPCRIWLCADDYGMSPAVNRGIRDLIFRRRINATSVMVVSRSFSTEEAAALVQAADRGAALGLHFTATAPFRPATWAFRPLAAGGTFLPLAAMFARGLLRQLNAEALKAEAQAQLAAFRKAFERPPDFVDGHQHVQLLPQVGDALLAAMATAAPRAWLRQCGRTTWRWNDGKGHLLDMLSRRLRVRAAACGIRTNPGFAGTYDFRRERDYEPLFASFLEGIPDGGVVMCHPGFVDAELRRLDSLTAMREREYEFFAGDRFAEIMEAHGLALA